MTVTLLAYALPSGADVDLAAPLGDAWRRAHAFDLESALETFGTTEFAGRSAEQYRANRADASSLRIIDEFLLALPGTALTPEVLRAEGVAIEHAAGDDVDAVTGERFVAIASLVRSRNDNLHKGELWLHTDRRWRGCGIGGALLTFARAQFRAHGRTEIEAWAAARPAREDAPDAVRPVSGSGAVAADAASTPFFARRGFGLEQIEKFSAIDRLDDAADRARIRGHAAALKAEAAGAADGYELLSYRGGTPADLAAAVARMYTRFSADIPSGEGDEETVFTAEKVAEIDRRAANQGVTFQTTVARCTASGELVGYTTIARREGSAGATQEDTWVAGEHRGHRLGLLMKAHNLLAVLAADADATLARIYTWNADENAHMWAINERIGFTPVGAEAAWRSFLVGDTWQAARP